jgi:DNA-binding MarR family transcriptional regulator
VPKSASGATETPGNATLALERFLPYRLSVLSNTVSQAIARDYESRFDLSIPEWRVLAVVARYPGISAVDVVTRTAMDKVAVSRAVARLTESGRLVRELDRSDRRRARLVLSTTGRAVYRKVVPVARRYEADLAGALDDDERHVLDALLAKLLARAHALDSGPRAESL